jgi:hypothetical protein
MEEGASRARSLKKEGAPREGTHEEKDSNKEEGTSI